MAFPLCNVFLETKPEYKKNYIEATKTIFMLKHTSDGGTPPRISIPCLRGNKYRKVPLTILSQSLSFTRAVKIEYQCMKMSSMQQYRSHPSQNKKKLFEENWTFPHCIFPASPHITPITEPRSFDPLKAKFIAKSVISAGAQETTTLRCAKKGGMN